MKKNKYFLLAFSTLTALLLLNSCKKARDYIHDHPDAPASLCRITQLDFLGLIVNIDYNARGNPVHMHYDGSLGFAFISEQYFRYDHNDRLTQYYVSSYQGTSAREWHKYGYPGKNLISDTAILFAGDINDPAPPPTTPGTNIYLYKFNAEGKMIGIASTVYGSNQPPGAFTPVEYDARGNKIVPYSSEVLYDSTVNVYRTNKVWQLVYQDYSRNNRIYRPDSWNNPADVILPVTVNPAGLPSALPWIGFDIVSFNFFINPDSQYYYSIHYACQLPGQQGY